MSAPCTSRIFWLPATALLALLLMTGCSVIVEDELKARDTDAGGRVDAGGTDAGGDDDSGTDAGPPGETCTTDAQCISFDPFNCNRICGEGGRCEDGPSPDGTRCGTGSNQHCVAQTCVMRTCGDGFLDRDATPPEYCDDGNDVDTDGCNNRCTRSCVPPAPANCADSNPCNGEEVCGAMSICRASAPPADGTPCDMRTGPAGVCRSGTCVAEG